MDGTALSMHGIVVKKSEEKIEINIREDEDDPVFAITDLLIHLVKDQMEKKMSEDYRRGPEHPGGEPLWNQGKRIR